MKKVYVVQLTSDVDMTSLNDFGKVVELVPAGMPINYSAPGYLVAVIKQALRDAGPEDYFVLWSPLPLLFGIAFAEMSYLCGGFVRCLRWDKQRRQYVEFVIDMGEA